MTDPAQQARLLRQAAGAFAYLGIEADRYHRTSEACEYDSLHDQANKWADALDAAVAAGKPCPSCAERMEPYHSENWLVGAGWSNPGRLEERVVAWRFVTPEAAMCSDGACPDWEIPHTHHDVTPEAEPTEG